MTRGDRMLLAGILLAAVACATLLYGPFLRPDSPKALRAVVTVDGKTVRLVELPGNGSFALQGHSGPAVVEVAGMRIRMAEAHCPGGNCLKQGWIGRQGEAIVCVPGQIVIRMEGATVLDAVTR